MCIIHVSSDLHKGCTHMILTRRRVERRVKHSIPTGIFGRLEGELLVAFRLLVNTSTRAREPSIRVSLLHTNDLVILLRSLAARTAICINLRDSASPREERKARLIRTHVYTVHRGPIPAYGAPALRQRTAFDEMLAAAN
jgi:hypothetical protein